MSFKVVFTVIVVCVNNVKTNNLCVKERASCTYQLWDELVSRNACLMEYYPLNSLNCTDLPMDFDVNHQKSLGNIRLETYIDDIYERTLFNITFSKIHWNNLSYRFTQHQQIPTAATSVNSCRTFRIWENITVPQNFELSYDCPWSLPENEGKTFVLEYIARADSTVNFKQFIFKIPIYYNINEKADVQKRELFLYIDYTNTQMLKLHIQLLPTRYNVTDYKIEVWRDRGDEPQLLDVRFVDPKDHDKEVIFEYNTWNVRGNYYFLVSFMNNECHEDSCYKTKSPKILISRRSNNLVIGIVGASVILPVLLFSVFIWNKQCKLRESLVADGETKALLIYTPSTDAHYNVVVNLTQTLLKVFNIQVLLDVLDIPHTKHKDPLLWCSEAFEQATHIIYIASPDCNNPKPSLYKTQTSAMRFLKEEISREHSDKKILTVTFPYSSNNIPDILKHFKRFDLMKDFDDFISYLVKYDKQSAFLIKSIFKRNRLMYYAEHEFYIDLVNAVKKGNVDKQLPFRKPIVKPQIKVVAPSIENLHKNVEEEEKKTLISIEEKCQHEFNIRDLNLSGQEMTVIRAEEKPTETNFDIRNLNL